MEFKFLKLRDLQGKTPSFPAAGEVHIIYVPEPDDSNLHKAGAGRAMIEKSFLIICVLTKVWYACMNLEVLFREQTKFEITLAIRCPVLRSVTYC